MMTGPFDATDTLFRVLVNDDGQHCLWPEPTEAPDGWVATFGPEERQACLDHVRRHWTDLRPRRLRDAVS